MKNRIITFTTILLAFGFLALARTMQAVVPPPDGGYPNRNTAEGDDALLNLTTGFGNTALGWHALADNTTGNSNTATGSEALQSNNTGGFNTATGKGALGSNSTGDSNTATGVNALRENTTGHSNTAIGANALLLNTEGGSNTATGVRALENNTTGGLNTAVGFHALAGTRIPKFQNPGSFNTATGAFALRNNDFGQNNVAQGLQALFSNTTGNENTGIGLNALFSNTIGSRNTALGTGAGGALTTGSDNIVIGNSGVAGEGNTIRIGTQGTQTRTFVAGIIGTAIGPSVPVRANLFGQLGTIGSSARFKQNIKAMDKASEAIHALKPVTFRYKQELDPESTLEFGLVAEDVEKVNPDLIVRDKEGKPYSVRYDQVNAMLLNEFLKVHRTVQEQGATITQQRKDFEAAIAQQQKQIEALTATVKEQASQIQKVSAQFELSRAEPKTAVK